MPKLFGFDKMNKHQLQQEIKQRANALNKEYLIAEQAYKNTIKEAENKRHLSLEEISRQYQETLDKINLSDEEAFDDIKNKSQETILNLGISDLPWNHNVWQNYDPSMISRIPDTIRIGTLSYQGKSKYFETPAIIPIFSLGKNILIEAKGSGKEIARLTIQSIALRLLSLVPAGKLRLICIDPVGLGETVAGFIQDLPDSITQGKAWTEPSHIEQQLANLEQDMATIKQKYLGIRYSTIEEYNQDAGMVEEPYRLLIVSDFPARFSDFAAQRLISIATNGPAVGVFVLAMVDNDTKFPYNFNLEDLERTSHLITCDSTSARWKEGKLDNCTLVLDSPPAKEFFIRLIQQISETAKDQNKVEVSFKGEVDDQTHWWAESACKEVRFPIGQLGAKKYQYMSINGDQEPDALIIGKVGYGKSNLLQVIIDSLITRYSPQEVSLYLLDLKQVTFEVYAKYKIPHAKVVAIKAEMEFALSVLNRVDQELKHRKDLFTTIGELDLAGYRKTSGITIPRIFLFIDEFQDLFYDDQLGRLAENILENLVREGRSFGIHIILASQTLRGQHTLPNVIKDLIPIRIALQCADADARLILSDDNSEAFLLERPGEAIYNNLNGRVEGNSRFQTFWLDKNERETVIKNIITYASEKGVHPDPEQIIFDGREGVNIETNHELQELFEKYPPIKNLSTQLAWIGGSIEIKPHTSLAFHRSAGKNLIISGGDNSDSTVTALTSSILISLAAQYPNDAAKYFIVNFNESDQSTDYYANLINVLHLNAQVFITQRDAERTITNLSNELIEREKSKILKSLPDYYLIILGVQKFRRLRSDAIDEVGQETLSSLLMKICNQGPELGVFTLVNCDNLRNFERGLGRSGLDEFDLRVGLQMSSDDSRTLFENEKASVLGPYRGLLMDINKQNTPERFRPYTLPNLDLISRMLRKQ